MNIIFVYFFNVAWYAKVDLNGNGIVELKFRQQQKPTNAAILQRAQDYKQAVIDSRLAQEQAEQAAKERARRQEFRLVANVHQEYASGRAGAGVGRGDQQYQG